MATLNIIESGVTVSKFIEDINDNFHNINTELNNTNEEKQSKIYIMTADTTSGTITINSDGIPNGGADGDIVIVYE